MNKQEKEARKGKAFVGKIKESELVQSLWKWICIHKEISVLGGLLLVLAIGAVTDTGKKSDETAATTAKETITIIGSSNTTAAAAAGETENPQQDIITLVTRYFNALSNCDIDALNSICETTEPFDMAVLEEQASYIEDYGNLDCTIMNGLLEGTYVVYVYYEMKFYYIDTPAPALVQLYIKTDKDQMPYIYQGVIDGELSAYIAELTAGEEIARLADEVDRKLQIACAADPNLDTFIRALQNQVQRVSLEEDEPARLHDAQTETEDMQSISAEADRR